MTPGTRYVPNPDPLYVGPDSDRDSDHAAQLAQARRARLAIWTAFLVGATVGLLVGVVAFGVGVVLAAAVLR